MIKDLAKDIVSEENKINDGNRGKKWGKTMKFSERRFVTEV